MLPKEFIKKHKIKLNKIEVKLCRDAMRMMRESLDVNHDESHIYRILDYWDEFIATREYKVITDEINLKALFVSICWHDIWKAGCDPKSVLMLLPDIWRDGTGSAHEFVRAARKAGLETEKIREIKYIIRKHSSVQFLPARNLEAKLLQDFDALDCFSFERIYLVEKKYLIDRPFNWPTLRLARYVAMVFVKNKKEESFNFLWSRDSFRRKQKAVLDKIMPEIDEYEQLLRLMDNNQQLEFEKMYIQLKDKYLNRPELLEKPDDPF